MGLTMTSLEMQMSDAGMSIPIRRERTQFDLRKETGVYKFDFSSQSSLQKCAVWITISILVLFAILAGVPELVKYQAKHNFDHKFWA